MLKKINAVKARQIFGQIMNEVQLRNDEYIIERNGKPIAALVPVWTIINRQKKTENFFTLLDNARSNIPENMSEETVQKIIKDSIKKVRK